MIAMPNQAWGAVDLIKGTVELSPAPPEAAQNVAPNIAFTFDDSGSMAWTYMGDLPPFSGTTWNGPWACAGVIDPDAKADDDFRQATMNGVYYNPNVSYDVPLRADGTPFPQADASLRAVWTDGIAVNRRYQRVNASAPGFYNNPNASKSATSADAGRRSNLMATSANQRWRCADTLTSPMDGKLVTLSDGSTIRYPQGGPYYYRLKRGMGRNQLFRAANWEAIPVPSTQYQNFANWYAYYRTRNQVARTAAVRVFGRLGKPQDGGGFGSPFRITWQLLNNNSFLLPANSIISELIDLPGCVNGGSANPSLTQVGNARVIPDCYRSAFFNLLLTAPANGGTPIRTATIRAGDFFKRSGTDLRNPYWTHAKGSNKGKELYCRRNYHMLVTDGLWNNDNVTRSRVTLPGNATTLPDGVRFPSLSPGSPTALYKATAEARGQASLSDLAFHYWATNLRPDLYKPSQAQIVPPYIPDKTLGITPSSSDSGSSVTATNINQEIYFNPKNDPATWPHVAQYLIGMGVAGTLTLSDDIHCVTPQSDACRLRKGTLSWPVPNGNENGILANVDDTWHAALAGRGGYFNASNPGALVEQLEQILTNISRRNIPPAIGRVTSSVLRPGVLGFQTVYTPGEWHGSLQAMHVNAKGEFGNLAWDASAILTDRIQTLPADRNILSSTFDNQGRFARGIAFRRFADLDAEGQNLLSAMPSQSQDTGQARMDWLRGERSLETANVLRSRAQLMGAITNSQPLYVAYPTQAYRNTWPAGSPESVANANGEGYDSFSSKHLKRRPVVYVGANDGMLHAIDASQERSGSGAIVPTSDAGRELFAYVPRIIYESLGSMTARNTFTYRPTVDGTPISRDVFFADGASTGWRTLLVGNLRLGGRGIFALDITNPDEVTEKNASDKVLWEFHADQVVHPRYGSGSSANLGYTYGQPNIARLAHGRWVVLLSSGYFPDCGKLSKPTPCHDIPEASSAFSSLFVLDAQSGELIREIRTPITGGLISHGLGTPVVGDYNRDQIDDVAFAGDLLGNLWRFDLSSANPNEWSATLAFMPSKPAGQPITVMPRLFPDPATGRFLVLFGTGQFLGIDDISDAIQTQSIYGIRDVASPVSRAMLLEQSLVEQTDARGVVSLGVTRRPIENHHLGWYIDLKRPGKNGERVVVTPLALFNANQAMLTTLIPANGDPCNPRNGGAYVIVDAINGGAGGTPGSSDWTDNGDIYGRAGGELDEAPIGGSLTPGIPIGGGHIYLPGLRTPQGSAPEAEDAIWRRRSWNRLQ